MAGNKEAHIALFALLVVVIVLSLPSYALETENTSYYADINATVDVAGFVTIAGSTDHPGLIVEDSENFTSKNEGNWLFNLTIDGNFTQYYISLLLPKKASLEYVDTLGHYRIESQPEGLSIKAFGENKKLELIVQYNLAKEETLGTSSSSNKFEYVLYVSISIAFLFLIGSLLYLMFSSMKSPFRKIAQSAGKETKEDEIFDQAKVSLADLPSHMKNNLVRLPLRQKKIIDVLMKSNRPMTQYEIEDRLKIPKSSVSRNIHSLELKGIIEMQRVGMSNMIRIKK